MLLLLALVLTLNATAFALGQSELDAAVQDMAAFMQKAVPNPQVGSIGGEWAVLGLARSGINVPESYYQKYYATVEQYVKQRSGVLHAQKYTEYSRVIVALSAIGKDARNVGGYDLTKPLADYDKTIWQGMNGPIWALIALDSANYPMPEDGTAATQASRQMYIDRILDRQLSDGGWSLTGEGASDPDITGMALQALAKYQNQPAVKTATEEALSCLSAKQDEKGGFSSWGSNNSESCVQVLTALCELGISLDDPRFVKNGNTVLDNLMTFYRKGAGFSHTADGSGNNQMAAEQGFYALVAAKRALEGKNTLYNMSDALTLSDAAQTTPAQGTETSGKHADVKVPAVTEQGKTFGDVAAHANRAAIEAMASRGIISGKGNGYAPDEGMTRAEFAKIVVGALGLTPKANDSFSDVAASAWYAPSVGTASEYGIITGVGGGKFNPNGSITRQEAAVMTARAAKLCGLETEMDAAAVRNMLAQFSDYTKSAEWARSALASCCQNGILDQSDLTVRPLDAVTRAEVAQMLYNMLGSAKLI